MRQFLIKYQFKTGTEEAWHQHIAEFIAALDSDPDLKGKISYRCMKQKGSLSYYHLATVTDDRAGTALQSKDFFKRYTDETKRVAAGGEVEVVPLDMVGATAFVA